MKNKSLNIILIILLLMSVTAFAAPDFDLLDNDLPVFVKGELIINFKKGVSYKEKLNVIHRYDGALIEEFGMINSMRIKINIEQDIKEALDLYSRDYSVEAVHPNYIYHAFEVVPNDRDFSQLWALDNNGQRILNSSYIDSEGNDINNPGITGKDMDLVNAWGIIKNTNGDSGDISDDVIIAVVDTGVNYTHVDLSGNILKENGMVKGWDFIGNDNDPMDLNGHGTHVAGIIGAKGNNKIGSTGVCWDTKIMPVRVLDELGRGSSAEIVKGINWAVANGAHIINLSLGMYRSASWHSYDDHSIRRAIAFSEGEVTFVAAAGNERMNLNSHDYNMLPCEYDQDNIICVAALDQNYDLAWFSNYGNIAVDVAAPGTNVFSTWAGNEKVIIEDFHDISYNGTPYCDWIRDSSDDMHWDYTAFESEDGDIHTLTIPRDLSLDDEIEIYYSKSLNSIAYKDFDLVAGSTFNSLMLYSIIDTREGDFLNIGVMPGLGNPINDGRLLESGIYYEGFRNKRYYFTLPEDLNGLDKISIGFQFNSNDDDELGKGIGIYFLMLTSIDSKTTYDPHDSSVGFSVINGTSMAAPYVTGIAALLKAYNPHYTPVDIANAVINSGDAEDHLGLYVKSGRAADAYKALLYVHPPQNLDVEIEY